MEYIKLTLRKWLTELQQNNTTDKNNTTIEQANNLITKQQMNHPTNMDSKKRKLGCQIIN